MWKENGAKIAEVARKDQRSPSFASFRITSHPHVLSQLELQLQNTRKLNAPDALTSSTVFVASKGHAKTISGIATSI
jgi:hypothetical protein